eukprot:CAMPEP_0174742016 /NCGR_PEP_ID=MMETSP1094-20130205/77797_1 /TAXON_ID=156173 /ORGANISM="Chrysochromulina brevifilum, Strain UTEX LB 985" /LENGTH=54 /DNA_ID=CAMNT_0015946007 /DNA_START=104 /DNA_END=264 /DNA_ORIENTATION=+
MPRELPVAWRRPVGLCPPVVVKPMRRSSPALLHACASTRRGQAQHRRRRRRARA